MDPLTHALASYSLARAVLPRVSLRVTVAAILAGAVADLDSIAFFFGPSAYLTFYRTALHSVLAALVFAALAAIAVRVSARSDAAATPPKIIFATMAGVTLLHLLLDVFQTTGIQLFWPFHPARFALDYVAHLDLWISGALVAGIVLPLFFAMVTSEIESRAQSPAGRFGARIALAAVFLYAGSRGLLHQAAMERISSRSYHGETPRRVAALPESFSMFQWHGLVETISAIHGVDVAVGLFPLFDPESATSSFKPEPSLALSAAQSTQEARRFLVAASFPKASVEGTPSGSHVILRDLAYPYDHAGVAIDALIDTAPSGAVVSSELAFTSTN